MVNYTILDTLARYSRRFTDSKRNHNTITQDQVKNLIIDLLQECNDEEIDYIREKLNEE